MNVQVVNRGSPLEMTKDSAFICNVVIDRQTKTFKI
jgi:hypothetical protein